MDMYVNINLDNVNAEEVFLFLVGIMFHILYGMI